MDNQFHNAVTVIMVVRNGEKYLREAIDSVLESDAFIHEILVIDGESSDGTRQIAESFPKVRVVPQQGKGIARAYNQGIAMASTEFVAFNSHDDIWNKRKLELQLALVAEKPELQIVAGMAQHFLDGECKSVPNGFRKELLDPHVAFNMEMLLARRDVFAVVGSFDEQLNTAEDVDWFCRARDMQIPSGVVPEVILRKRIHTSNAHFAATNDHFLLRALQKSAQRKRQKEGSGQLTD
jgi:Predicted glycosyltransferases